MRLLISNHLRVANESLRRNRMRTWLTTLGITLGVMCITLILSLSYGATQLVSGQINELGGNIAVIRPGDDKPAQDFRAALIPFGGENFTASSLTEQDYRAVKDLEGVEAAAPLMSISGSVSTTSGERSIAAPIAATTPELETISDLKVRDGQFIDTVTNQNTAVIGRQLSVDLFGTDQSIGQLFNIRGQQFTVIGVLQSVPDSINYNNLNINSAAIINLDSGKSFNQGIAQIRQINIKAHSTKDLGATTELAEQIITDNHSGEQDFTILTGDEIAHSTSLLFTVVATVAYIISGVALVIGGIGIMNIMLANVAERTREIGIRKAVGASNYHITFQFLIEALVMSVSGGVLGFIIGYTLAFFAGTLLPFNPGFTWWVPLVSLGTSVFVGVLFGLYPAIRAARKNPIEALRQYH